jgi:hypothetical protein
MKIFFAIVPFFFSMFSLAQTPKNIEQILLQKFERISYWNSMFHNSSKSFSSDSLEYANADFEKSLLAYASKNTSTIYTGFKLLHEAGLGILTSPDSLCRIYTWNTWMGGTMVKYANIFQYRIGSKLYAKKSNVNEYDFGCSYHQLSQIKSNNKTYYLATSIAKLSTREFLGGIEVFTLESGKPKPAKIIKTASGITSGLSYDMDMAATTNLSNEVAWENMETIFDSKKNEILVPVILDNKRITTRKIVYRFTGKYFERV